MRVVTHDKVYFAQTLCLGVACVAFLLFPHHVLSSITPSTQSERLDAARLGLASELLRVLGGGACVAGAGLSYTLARHVKYDLTTRGEASLVMAGSWFAGGILVVLAVASGHFYQLPLLLALFTSSAFAALHAVLAATDSSLASRYAP